MQGGSKRSVLQPINLRMDTVGRPQLQLELHAESDGGPCLLFRFDLLLRHRRTILDEMLMTAALRLLRFLQGVHPKS